MSSRPSSNFQEQLDALSMLVHAGDRSVQSESFSFELPDPAVTAGMRSQRLSDFFDEEPPFRQRAQSVAEAKRSMAQKLKAFDLVIEGPERRSTR